jgi:hypothetical protein
MAHIAEGMKSNKSLVKSLEYVYIKDSGLKQFEIEKLFDNLGFNLYAVDSTTQL